MEVLHIKLLIGGSPCTRWSIAQTKNRETEPEGLGWELFKNYLIAKEKFKPDYFLYENNKSMSLAIREQITEELGVEPIMINSALVSAQNRQRLYWTNIPDVEQPKDRGILLRDILESGVCWSDKSHTIDASYYKGGNFSGVERQSGKRLMVAEVININPSGHGMNGAVMQINGKSRTLTTNKGEGPKIIEPVDGYAMRQVGRRINENGHRADYDQSIEHFQRFEVNENPQKTNCLTTVQKDNMIAQPVYHATQGKEYLVYEVRDGQITIKDKKHPINLPDGFYIIRKLTVTECMRLQTVPEDYVFPVSNSQAYKMLGNGWTCDIIAHILSYAPGITSEPLKVLSMYDGMSCGHIALNKLGAHIDKYYATEIDKYAVQTTQHNFPDTIQLGDAFQVREDGWALPSKPIYCADMSV